LEPTKCDNLASVPKSDLRQYVGSLSPAKLAEVDHALSIALELRF
jgi:mRNA-degrading endonuclease toxin of MazEF toxin-antitoxin module